MKKKRKRPMTAARIARLKNRLLREHLAAEKEAEVLARRRLAFMQGYWRELAERQKVLAVAFVPIFLIGEGGKNNMAKYEPKDEIRLSPGTYLKPDVFVSQIEADGLGKNAWVTRILGLEVSSNQTVLLKRQFIDPEGGDRSPTKNSGSLTFRISEPGIYEVRNFTGMKDGKPVSMDGLLLVEDGTIRKLAIEEMQAWAKVEAMNQKSSASDDAGF